MNIRILGAHNCETRTTGCICLIINDVLAIDAGELTSSLSMSEQQKLKAILLSHQHYDHIRDDLSPNIHIKVIGTGRKGKGKR